MLIANTRTLAGDGERLLAVWLAEPDTRTTVELCNWLATDDACPNQRATGRQILADVGREGRVHTHHRVGVLLAVGRTLLAAGELSRSLSIFVLAAHLAPSEPLVYRLLGEVLHLRGDVVRASRMLDRAIAGGMTDPETLAWYERARIASDDAPTMAG